MTIEEVKALKGGELIQHSSPKYPLLGVVVDPRIWRASKRPANPDVRVQWIGGGCQISSHDYHGWQYMKVISPEAIHTSVKYDDLSNQPTVAK
jgi:hypothetical protein